MKSQYTDLKIYKEYLWGLVKTRQLLCNFDVIQHIRRHHPELSVMLFHDQNSRNVYSTENFNEASPVWKPEKIRTQVKIFDKLRFFLPESIDDLLLWMGIRDYRQEVDHLAHIIYEERMDNIQPSNPG